MLVALSCLLVLLSTTVVWSHRTLLDTGTFVGTVGPVFKNPTVDSAVAARATDKLFTELNLQARLHAALPPKASFAAVPITNATKGFVTGELTKVLASPKFQAVRTGTLTATHRQLVAVLRGQNTAAVSTSGGYIVLNTVPALNQALAKVSGLASQLTGKHVTLPTITSAEVPQQQAAKLSKALGVTLPANFGEITLVRSSDLATVRRGVKAFDGLTAAWFTAWVVWAWLALASVVAVSGALTARAVAPAARKPSRIRPEAALRRPGGTKPLASSTTEPMSTMATSSPRTAAGRRPPGLPVRWPG